jgi:hypothetical protein
MTGKVHGEETQLVTPSLHSTKQFISFLLGVCGAPCLHPLQQSRIVGRISIHKAYDKALSSILK